MKMRMLTSNNASENNHMSRRSFLATAGGTFLAGHVLRSTADSNLAPIDIGTQKQLFIDEKFIQSKRNVTLSLTPPDLQRENLLVADRPWESGRVCSTGSVVQHQGKVILWYDAREWDPERSTTKGMRYCYAESEDGIHFQKPNARLIDWNGSKENNLVLIGGQGAMFVDPHDVPAKRFKALMDMSPQLEPLKWSQLDGVQSHWVCLFTSPDGIRWTRAPKVVFPMWLGALQSVIWDNRLQKWVLYLRAHRPYRCFGRTTVDLGKLEEPYPFSPQAGRSYEKLGENGLKDELPIVMDRDNLDPPGGQSYWMNAWKYPEAEDVYFAFVPMWFEGRGGTGGSDRIEAQLAISRDGIQWSRPWRRAVIPPGAPSMSASGQIWPLPEPIIRNEEVWLYYLSEPDTHLGTLQPPNYLSPSEADLMKDPKRVFETCVVARAIWRLDRFVAADAGPEGGELLTPPILFSGGELRINANAGASGQLRVAVERPSGPAIPGYTLQDAIPIQGNGLALTARWKGHHSVRLVAGQPVRLRFALTNCQLYSFQTVPGT